MVKKPPPPPVVQLRVAAEGRHPHFPRKMIRKPTTLVPAGSVVRVKDKEGRYLGQGFYNPRAGLSLRMVTWRKDEQVDLDLLSRRLEAAVRLRRDLLRLDRVTDAYRLVHGDGDGLPGLVVDKLGKILVVEVRLLGMQPFLDGLGRRLKKLVPNQGMVLVTEQRAAKVEGLEPPPPAPRDLEVEVREGKARFLVRPGQGHKTGFFCDQRDQRLQAERFARGRRVLDLCCYTGGFAVHCALGGARSVTALDLDEKILPQARANFRRNQVKVVLKKGDAFDFLREAASAGKEWDLVILDPPAFARGRGQVTAAVEKYQDLNRLAWKVLAQGGLLLSCSCSPPVGPELFLKAVRGAVEGFSGLARVLATGGAGPDHPLHLHCPETRYLKTVWLQKER